MKSAARVSNIFALSVSLFVPITMNAQPTETNYDEAKVPKYTLPDPLVSSEGTRITTSHEWQQKRRPEILRMFESQMYGRSPGRPTKMKWETTSVDKNALGNQATRKEVAVYFEGRKEGPRMDILIYQPNSAKKPVPAFLGLNFNGNQAVHTDPGIT